MTHDRQANLGFIIAMAAAMATWVVATCTISNQLIVMVGVMVTIPIMVLTWVNYEPEGQRASFSTMASMVGGTAGGVIGGLIGTAP